MMEENMNVEFKELDPETGRLPNSVPKEIIAFANTDGGDLYIGIRDDGSIAGVIDTDDVMRRVINVAHDKILPDITPFLQVDPIEMDGKKVVRASVAVGTERPYYLKKEGLSPNGVFIRVGSACIPLSENGIREIIMETSGKSYEEMRSFNQDLTFVSLKAVMKSSNIEFEMAQMRTLKMIGKDNLFTNLALLLSDQCIHTIKVAVFQGKGDTVFRERKEFCGSLVKQLDEAYKFIDLLNRTKATFAGLKRTDVRDYPEDAMREALLNSIIHRDYLFSGSTIINVFDDHVEFISLGGLVRGISMEAIFLGASQSRNPNLCSVFQRLGFVESYGTGIRKIISLYNGFSHQPVFRTAEGVFSVQLFNRNEFSEENPNEDDIVGIKGSILSIVKEKGKITRKIVEDTFGVSTAKAYGLLKELCDEKLLVQYKNGPHTLYFAPGKKPLGKTMKD